MNDLRQSIIEPRQLNPAWYSPNTKEEQKGREGKKERILKEEKYTMQETAHSSIPITIIFFFKMHLWEKGRKKNVETRALISLSVQPHPLNASEKI